MEAEQGLISPLGLGKLSVEVITVWERLDPSRTWEDEEELPWLVPHEQLTPGWSHSRSLP